MGKSNCTAWGFLRSLFPSLFVGVFLVSPVAAIPNQTLNPHSDAMADISWIQDDTRNPDMTNHFHLPLRNGESISVSSNLSNYGLKSNMGWVAFAVWDNDQYRFQDTPEIGDARNALLDSFAHGYIDPAHPPLYSYDTTVPASAKAPLADAFAAWAQAAQNAAAGKKSPAGNPLSTGISAKAASSGRGQFQYQFIDGLEAARNEYAEWVFSTDQIAGRVTQTMSMVFETNPYNFVRAPAGYLIREKNKGTYTNTFTQDVGWSFDKTRQTASNIDLQYSRISDGMVFDDLTTVDPNAKLTTDIGTQIPAGDFVQFYKMDFYTIALHETGHILGLLHPAGDPTGNIMRASIQQNAEWGNMMQSIDANSAYGAAELYTIALPEPGMMGILLIGLLLTRYKSSRPC